MTLIDIPLLAIAVLLFLALRNERVWYCRDQVINAIAATDHDIFDDLWTKFHSKTYNQCLWEFKHWTAAGFYPELKDIL